VPNKSLDASGGGVFRIITGPAKGALIRAAASTQTLCTGAFENMATGDVRLVVAVAAIARDTSRAHLKCGCVVARSALR